MAIPGSAAVSADKLQTRRPRAGASATIPWGTPGQEGVFKSRPLQLKTGSPNGIIADGAIQNLA